MKKFRNIGYEHGAIFCISPRVTSCSYLLPSKSHPVSYARFACDETCLRFRRALFCIKPTAPLLRNSRSCHMHSHSRGASHRSMLIPGCFLYKLRIAPCFALAQSYRHSHFRAAYASLRAHTCCLRNRIQSLTRASRATRPVCVFEELIQKTVSCRGRRRIRCVRGVPDGFLVLRYLRG